MLTDGDDTCDGNPCNRARDLYSHYGVRTFIVAFGAQPVAGGAMECAAAAGGTGAPYYPQTEGELTETLNQIYEAAAAGADPSAAGCWAGVACWFTASAV